MIDDQRIEIRTAVRQIWADISTLLEAEKFHLRRSLILKVAGHSFVLTSMGRVSLDYKYKLCLYVFIIFYNNIQIFCLNSLSSI